MDFGMHAQPLGVLDARASVQLGDHACDWPFHLCTPRMASLVKLPGPGSGDEGACNGATLRLRTLQRSDVHIRLALYGHARAR